MIAKIERYQGDLSWVKARGSYVADEPLTREILGLNDEGVVELLVLAERLVGLGYPGFLRNEHDDSEWALDGADLFLSALALPGVEVGAWGEVKDFPSRVKLSRMGEKEKIVLKLNLKLDEARLLQERWGGLE